jgi:hypothetical protein
MGLLRLIAAFVLVWIGLIFVIFGFNAFMILNLPAGSMQFYSGMIVVFTGLFLIVVGVCYIMGELTH